MSLNSRIPIIPSADLEKSLRFWIDGLGSAVESEMRADGKLLGCMIRNDTLCFMLNQRAGVPEKPEYYEGIRLYWSPSDLAETREHLRGWVMQFQVSNSGAMECRSSS